jgi:hypothetical protein
MTPDWIRTVIALAVMVALVLGALYAVAELAH